MATMTCSLCSRALRKDNRSGMCAKCQQSAAGQRARYVPQRRGERTMRMYLGLGFDGHRYAPLEPDTEPDTWVTYCLDCDRFLVCDLEEAPAPYGSATMGACPGHVVLAPSRRLDEFDLDYSTTSASAERAGAGDVGGVRYLNWEDKESHFGALAPMGKSA